MNVIQKKLAEWGKTLHDGDRIYYENDELIICNSQGCEIDRYSVETHTASGEMERPSRELVKSILTLYSEGDVTDQEIDAVYHSFELEEVYSGED